MTYKYGEMMRNLFLIICLLLSGCDSNKLSNVENTSKQASICKVHQITSNECEKFDKALEIAELKATQAGIDHERISASRQIGSKVVAGSANDSPYQRIKRSLEGKPFYIDPIEDNFTPYKTSCPKLDPDEGEIDPDELFKMMERIGRDKKEYQAVAYFQDGRVFNVFFLKVVSPCRPESYTDIKDQFPILTEDQLNNFKNGVYLKAAIYPDYKSIKVLIFETFEEAKEKYQELKG